MRNGKRGAAAVPLVTERGQEPTAAVQTVGLGSKSSREQPGERVWPALHPMDRGGEPHLAEGAELIVDEMARKAAATALAIKGHYLEGSGEGDPLPNRRLLQDYGQN